MTDPTTNPQLRPRLSILHRLGFSACAVVAGLLVLEFMARLVVPVPRGYFLLLPDTRPGFRLPAGLLAGVPGGLPRHSINSQGVAADPLSPRDAYRILAIGGSTTACNALDGPLTWPARLQAMLAERQPHGHVWVGNLGKEGLNTRHHLVTISRFLPQHPRVDAVIFLVGVNDLLARLAQDNDFEPMSLSQIDSSTDVLAKTFAITPPAVGLTPWYKRLGLWWLAVRTRTLLSALANPAAAKELTRARAWRRSARLVRPNLPELEPALREYQQNLRSMILRARDQHLRMIVLTQPTLWKTEGMSKAEADSLVFGWVGRTLREGGEVYAPAALAGGMARYNEVTRRVCREQNVECLDLAANLKSDLSVFYDDDHFNVAGAEQVARLLADHLLQGPPLTPARPQ